MAYYTTDLVTIAKAGQNWLKPRGWDQSSAWSILKLDLTTVVMWSLDAIPALTKIADDAQENTALSTTTALSLLRGDGKPIPTKFADAIADLLMNPPNSRWPKLVSMNDGFYRINMGLVEVWDYPDPLGPRKHSKQAQDNFNRTSNLDGSTSSDGKFTWVETVSTTMTVNGSQLSITGVADSCAAQANFTLDTSDMDVQFDVVTNTRTTTECQCGAVARGTGDVAAGGGYLGALKDAGGTLTAEIFDLVTPVSLANVSVSSVTGTLRFTANGSALQIQRNGATVAAATDSTTLTGQKGGIRSSRDAAADVILIDNFMIQDVGFLTPTPIAWVTA